jgi:predicted nucleotidyltransferase/DNA-binding XRE family transcriptional regulator
MARGFYDLRGRISAERRARNEAKALALLVAMDLNELRNALQVTQEDLAARLKVAQSSISRLERRNDMLVGTLREVVEALGGELHLVAVFPGEGAVRIRRLERRRRQGGESEGRIVRLDELRRRRDEILMIARRHGAVNVRVFGSVVRDEAGAGSDVDFLVDMEVGHSLLDRAGLLVDLRDALGSDVDVATESSLRGRVRDRVLKEAVLL